MTDASPWPTHPWVTAGQGRLRFGVGVQPAWPALRDFVALLADLGFDAVWLTDHPARNPADCWTTLAALAVTTSRIRLGTLVCAVPYRSPTLLARLAADVDRFSDGRFILGLGIGWEAAEFGKLSLPYAPVPQRQAALEEAIAIICGLWRGEPFTYAGQHYHIEETRLPSSPVQQPRVPLLIAGGGERVTLRQVAAYADMSNFGATASMGAAVTTADIERKLTALRRHCDALGRPYESIVRSHNALGVFVAETEAAVQAKVEASTRHIPRAFLDYLRSSMVIGTPRQVIEYYRGLARAGLTYFIATVAPDEETVRLLAEQVVPAVIAT